MIPKTIHQTWKDRDVPERFRAAQESWRQHHPGWQCRFWTDADLDELVYERAPEIAELYDRSPEAIQRVDVARYVILREYGGLYADLDVECMKPVDDLLDGPSVALPLTTPFGVSNQLMLSVPGHALFQHVIDALPRAFRRWGKVWQRHVRVLTTTGPLFLTGRLREFGVRDDMRILSLDEHGHGDPALS